MILEEVSAHYGPVYAHAKRQAQLIKLLIKNAIAAVCFLVAMWFVVTGRAGLVNLEDEYEDTGDQTSSTLGSNASLLGGGILGLFSLVSAGSSTFTYATTPATKSEELEQDANKPNFKDKLGCVRFDRPTCHARAPSQRPLSTPLATWTRSRPISKC